MASLQLQRTDRNSDNLNAATELYFVVAVVVIYCTPIGQALGRQQSEIEAELSTELRQSQRLTFHVNMWTPTVNQNGCSALTANCGTRHRTKYTVQDRTACRWNRNCSVSTPSVQESIFRNKDQSTGATRSSMSSIKAYRRSRDMAPLILTVGIRWSWVVNFTLRPIYLRQRIAGTHWIWGWVSHGAGLDGLGKTTTFAPTGIWRWDRPSCRLVATPTTPRPANLSEGACPDCL